MTLKQRRLVKAVGKSRTIGEAMLKAGYSPVTAKKKTADVLRSVEVQNELAKNDQLAIDTHTSGFNATKLVTSPTEMDKEWPDWTAKLKSVEMHYKARGWLKESSTIETGDITINFNVSGIQPQSESPTRGLDLERSEEI